MVLRGLPVNQTSYSKEGLPCFDKVMHIFRGGATIIANQAQNYSTRCLRLIRQLEACLSCQAGANIYITPPGSHGFRAHYDRHDVFVLQLAGEKRWSLHDFAATLPYEDMPVQEIPTEIGNTPNREITLRQGDLLYVPRGLVHRASSTPDASSMHATIGLHPMIWRTLLENIVRDAGDQESELREALPPDKLFDQSSHLALEERAREMLARIGTRISMSRVVSQYRKTNLHFGENGGAIPTEDPTPFSQLAEKRFQLAHDCTVRLSSDRNFLDFLLPYRSHPLKLRKNCFFVPVSTLLKGGSLQASDFRPTLQGIDPCLAVYFLLANGIIEATE